HLRYPRRKSSVVGPAPASSLPKRPRSGREPKVRRSCEGAEASPSSPHVERRQGLPWRFEAKLRCETGRESTMRISAFCTAVLAYVVICHAPPAAAQVDQQRAQEYFKEAQALCERDGGRLWGVSICAPMVIGDARTRTVATSQPPDAPRPKLIGLVNGPIQWGDTMWAA